MMRRHKILMLTAIFVSLSFSVAFTAAMAQDDTLLDSDLISTGVLLTLLAVGPAVFITTTCFIRIVIVLAMVRHAFGMPETPPNPVIISLALFLTLFVMAPTMKTVMDDSISPMIAGDIGVETAIQRGSAPMRDFMLSQVRDQELETMYAISRMPLPERPEDVDLLVLTPAFILNELRIAFTIGFVIMLPFLMIDLIVSSILLSLGMMMVPPATISLPIKLLLFVVVDGWALIIEGLLGGFG